MYACVKESAYVSECTYVFLYVYEREKVYVYVYKIEYMFGHIHVCVWVCINGSHEEWLSG